MFRKWVLRLLNGFLWISNKVWKSIFRAIKSWLTLTSVDAHWGFFAFLFALFITILQVAIPIWIQPSIKDDLPMWITALINAGVIIFGLLFLSLAGHYIYIGIHCKASKGTNTVLEETNKKLDTVIERIDILITEIRKDREKNNDKPK
jgi:hypothetical protein